MGDRICLSCINDTRLCDKLLYKKWYAYLRDSCTMYSTLSKILEVLGE